MWFREPVGDRDDTDILLIEGNAEKATWTIDLIFESIGT